MTELESKVSDWLTNQEIDFDFESSLQNGRVDLQNMIVEFILADYTVLRIKKAEDTIEKVILEQMGFRVAGLKEEELITDLDSTLVKAISEMIQTWHVPISYAI